MWRIKMGKKNFLYDLSEVSGSLGWSIRSANNGHFPSTSLLVANRCLISAVDNLCQSKADVGKEDMLCAVAGFRKDRRVRLAHILGCSSLKKLVGLLQRTGLNAPDDDIKLLLIGGSPFFSMPMYDNCIPASYVAVFCTAFGISRTEFNQVFRSPLLKSGTISSSTWAKALKGHRKKVPSWLQEVDDLCRLSCAKMVNGIIQVR